MSSELKIMIVNLPLELLAHIFEFLTPKDISKLSKLCKTFHSTSQIDSIWETKSSQLPIPRFSIQNDELSFRLIYTKVLHKYWKLLGFWRRNVTHYGGLLHVSFDTVNGKIIGTEWNPPNYPNVKGPICGTLTFSVDAHSGFATCSPSDTNSSRHYCNITVGESESIDGKVRQFSTKCKTHTFHDDQSGLGIIIRSSHFNQLLPLGPLVSMEHRMMMLRKYSQIQAYKHYYDYTRLEWPQSMPGAIIQPGLFKGDYNSHGVELIMLTYVDEHAVNGIKVTGDPNIPAGQISFTGNLQEAFVLNLEQQVSISMLETAEVLNPLIPLCQLPLQPFRIPNNVFPGQQEFPNVCKGRFSGLGQIASDGFTNSNFIPGHWIVFNEDLFGFMWFGIKALGLFHRVQEKF